jgi:3-oxoacyl-[acyl-carrier protein] reductase
MAEAFAEAGAIVAVHYRSGRSSAETTAARIREGGGSAITVMADLTMAGEGSRLVSETAEAFGGLDVLINNAGGPVALEPVRTMSDGHFDAVFNLNARSVFETCQAAIPHLEKGEEASSIINVTSLSAKLGGSVGAALYGASKAFVAAFTKNLSRELAAKGVRVNALSPGYMETPLHEGLTPPELAASWTSQIPLGRAGKPEDCVGAALFLASPTLSGFITGQTIEVNGGQYTGN